MGADCQGSGMTYEVSGVGKCRTRNVPMSRYDRKERWFVKEKILFMEMNTVEYYWTLLNYLPMLCPNEHNHHQHELIALWYDLIFLIKEKQPYWQSLLKLSCDYREEFLK